MSRIDIIEASKLTGWAVSTLRKKTMLQVIPFIKLGGRVFFDKERLEQWIAEHAVEPLAVGK